MSMFTIIIIVIVALYILGSIKILREYERGVVFRLGRALPRGDAQPRKSDARRRTGRTSPWRFVNSLLLASPSTARPIAVRSRGDAASLEGCRDDVARGVRADAADDGGARADFRGGQCGVDG